MDRMKGQHQYEVQPNVLIVAYCLICKAVMCSLSKGETDRGVGKKLVEMTFEYNVFFIKAVVSDCPLNIYCRSASEHK